MDAERRDFLRLGIGLFVAAAVGCDKKKNPVVVDKPVVVKKPLSELEGGDYLHRVLVNHGLPRKYDVISLSDELTKEDVEKVYAFYRQHEDTLVEFSDVSEDAAYARIMTFEEKISMHTSRFLSGEKKTLLVDSSDIERGLDLLPANYYLIDGSYFMTTAGGDFKRAQNYNYPVNSQVYIFTTQPIEKGVHIEKVRLNQRESYVYQGLEHAVNTADQGKKITVVSIWDEVEKNNVLKIIQTARKKSLEISFVDLGSSQNNDVFDRISNLTGGKVYRD